MNDNQKNNYYDSIYRKNLLIENEILNNRINTDISVKNNNITLESVKLHLCDKHFNHVNKNKVKDTDDVSE